MPTPRSRVTAFAVLTVLTACDPTMFPWPTTTGIAASDGDTSSSGAGSGGDTAASSGEADTQGSGDTGSDGATSASASTLVVGSETAAETTGEGQTSGGSDGAAASSGDSEGQTSGGSDGAAASSGDSEGQSTGAVPVVCGDNIIDGDEVCDRDDVGGETCESQGFDGGALACMQACDAFDTSGCVTFSCGNGIREGREVCDGAALSDTTCVSLGFDAGDLACDANCGAFDTSGCITFSCGNGVREGVEACDGPDLGTETCVSRGFDTGVLSCATDCSGYDVSACIDWVCGNGVAEPNEVCDGVDLRGLDCVLAGFDAGTLVCADDCSERVTSGCYHWVCGNGVLEPDEQCEAGLLGGETCVGLGAVTGALACDAICGYDATGCAFPLAEVEPNDDGAVAVAANDFSAANAQVLTDDSFVAAAISPVGDDDVFAVHNTSAGYALLRVETFGAAGFGTCDAPTDTTLEIRTVGNALRTSNADDGLELCSLISGFLMQPRESVYVRAIDFGDNTAIASYFLHVELRPIVCGDGWAGFGEQCDDGNFLGGDGCSATCQFEGAVQEIEPNGTGAQVTATGLESHGDSVYGASLSPIGDRDRFRVVLDAARVVRFETFSTLGDCADLTTTMRLFDDADTQMATATTSGIANCSSLVYGLDAGTYYVQVEETGNNAMIPAYLLEIAAQAEQGVEAEPNDAIATATSSIQMAGSDVMVVGDHSINTDSDFFAIDVPTAGSSLRLELIEADRAVETCEGGGIQSRLTLYNAGGDVLVDDSTDGRGFCSMIDGTGSAPLDAGAHGLAAGTYYVEVRASNFAQTGAAGQFGYALVAAVRSP